MKQQKGITLIALVITIVVLIILAGVAISLTLSDNGIFNNARKARDMYSNAAGAEGNMINEVDQFMANELKNEAE
ncbi:MAG: hypothetical protein HFJ41_01640 [Clostridia bacterium]|nr:hypothetical protein [Clostridia bacterium]